MDVLDRLRAPENAAAAAERGLLVRWPECLPLGVVRRAPRLPRRVNGGRRVRAALESARCAGGRWSARAFARGV
jgi:hypothetical protein